MKKWFGLVSAIVVAAFIIIAILLAMDYPRMKWEQQQIREMDKMMREVEAEGQPTGDNPKGYP